MQCYVLSFGQIPPIKMSNLFFNEYNLKLISTEDRAENSKEGREIRTSSIETRFSRFLRESGLNKPEIVFRIH